MLKRILATLCSAAILMTSCQIVFAAEKASTNGFNSPVVPASNVTAATPAEIATLGTLPNGIGTIYKKTVTLGTGKHTEEDLFYYSNAMTQEGDYDFKAFLFEPTTNPETNGYGIHRMLRYSKYSSSGGYLGNIGFVLYNQKSTMGAWQAYSGTLSINKSDTNYANMFTTQRLGFRWNTGNDGWNSLQSDYPDAVGKTATLYFSINVSIEKVNNSIFNVEPALAANTTYATPEEIAALGSLPEGIGTIYKTTMTVRDRTTDEFDLFYYPKALTVEGDYDFKVFLFEPTTNPACDGTGLHRMLRYTKFNSSGGYVGNINYVLYDQGAPTGGWQVYSNTLSISKSDEKFASAYASDRIGFRWNIGNDASGFKMPADSVGKTATIYYSISLTAGIVPDEISAKIETTKWSGTDLFDESANLTAVGNEQAISAGTASADYTQIGTNLEWDASKLYRVSFKARGDASGTYSHDGRVQFRTSNLSEFARTIPQADLQTGVWKDYFMICDISTLEQTLLDGNKNLADHGTLKWQLFLRRGNVANSPVYFKDIVIEEAVPTAAGETPVYTSGIFTYENNSEDTISIPSGLLILAEYNADGSLNRAITKKFAKEEKTATDKNSAEVLVGGILPGTTGAARIDVLGYDATKTYKLYIWDSLTGMNSLFGVTASK